jgi:hypothetical protein
LTVELRSRVLDPAGWPPTNEGNAGRRQSPNPI